MSTVTYYVCDGCGRKTLSIYGKGWRIHETWRDGSQVDHYCDRHPTLRLQGMRSADRG
jgi:hypothetical protein